TEAGENENEAPSEEKEPERVRTSPLAVHMHEKDVKDDKKLKNKIKRGRVWGILALLLAVVLIAENAVLMFGGKGALDAEEPEEIIETEEPVEIIEASVLGSETLAGNWTYEYSLTKYWDSDGSGDYKEVTETIVSSGLAGVVDKGDNHMAAMVIPETMTVDEEDVVLGNTPEAFSAWYEEGAMCIQLKGTEQKYFAAGGAEPLIIRIPVSMDESGVVSGGTYEHTYEKEVSEMDMRYVISITFDKE
ncbi:MAG: hypothetical protein Q4G23_11210, partial [Clostridia bacterium]|nr:hypothetical protein [Clostridia bacterium]